MGRFNALRSHDFRLLFFGQLVSLTGTQMQQVAVAWQIYLLTKSALALGLIGLFRVIPVILLAVPSGVIVDALDRRRVMLITQSCFALSSLALAVLTYTDHITPAAMYCVLFFSGCALAFEVPARQSLLPLLVPREDLPNALSIHAMIWQLATIVGPSIGGIVLAHSGVTTVYIIDVISFSAVITGLLMMHHRGKPRGMEAISLRAALDGLRFMMSKPLIYRTTILDFVATFFGGSLLLMPIFADQLLNVGEQGLGLLLSAQPVGAAIAGAVLASRPTIKHQGKVLLISVAVYGAAITVFGASPWLGLSLFALAVSGAADLVSMVIRQTIRQLHTPDELRGRMTSVNMIFFIGGPQLGEAEAGFVARAFNARISVSSGGIVCIVAAALFALLTPSLRSYVHEPTRAEEHV